MHKKAIAFCGIALTLLVATPAHAQGLDVPGGGGGGAASGMTLQSLVPTPSAPVHTAHSTPRTEKPLEAYTKFFVRKEFDVTSGNDVQTIAYFMRQPDPPLNPEKRYPLVILLHDEMGVSQAGEYLLSADMRKNFPAFIAAPVLPARKIWAFPDKFPDAEAAPLVARYKGLPRGLPAAAQLVNEMEKEYQIDPKRVYVVGCGDGGFGVFGATIEYPTVFAAGVPINGAWTANDSPQMTKVPLLVMNGAADTTVPPGLGQNVAYYIQKNRGNVQFISLPTVTHDCGSPFFYSKATWTWLFKQHKK